MSLCQSILVCFYVLQSESMCLFSVLFGVSIEVCVSVFTKVSVIFPYLFSNLVSKILHLSCVGTVTMCVSVTVTLIIWVCDCDYNYNKWDRSDLVRDCDCKCGWRCLWINGNNSNLLCGNVNFTLSMNFTINMIVTMTITMSLIVTITIIFSVYVCRYKCDFECKFDCEGICVYNK